MALANIRYSPDVDAEKALPGGSTFVSLTTAATHDGQKMVTIPMNPNPDMFRIPKLPPKRQPSKWTIFALWFNMYR
jgi:hypothetical protein